MTGINWENIDKRLPLLIMEGMTLKSIGEKLNISTPSVSRRILFLNLGPLFENVRKHRMKNGKYVGGRIKSEYLNNDLIKRKCLNCDSSFLVNSRYIRLCPKCRKSINVWQGTNPCF